MLDLSQLVEESLGQARGRESAGRVQLTGEILSRSEVGGRRAGASRRVIAVCGALVLGGLGLTTLFVVAPAGAATTAPLSQFLLKAHEEPGFAVSGRANTITPRQG